MGAGLCRGIGSLEGEGSWDWNWLWKWLGWLDVFLSKGNLSLMVQVTRWEESSGDVKMHKAQGGASSASRLMAPLSTSPLLPPSFLDYVSRLGHRGRLLRQP